MTRLRHRFVFAVSTASVWLDHILRAFWILIFGVIFLAGLALLGFGAVIPPLMFQISLFVLLAIGFAYGLTQFKKPRLYDIEKRLTGFNRLVFNPYRALRDTPAHDLSASQMDMWDHRSGQARHMIARLFPAMPKPRLYQKDPKIFENLNSNKETETKEQEMFEETNLEEDFEIPAFLRKQKN